MANSAYIGEVRNFAFTYAPKNWAQCNGQLLSVNQNQALFAILGTTYGGNGSTTFALPNFQGRVPVHAGTSAGTGYALGQQGGSATVGLSGSQVAAHNHIANGSTLAPNTNAPGNGVLPGTLSSGTGYFTTDGSQPSTMSPNALANAGAGQSHENRQPYLVVNACICIAGLFPSRN